MPDIPETPYLLPDWLHGFEHWLKNLSDGEATFYSGVVLGLLLWVGRKIWQRMTRKPPVFAGETYDLNFPVNDNGALVGRDDALATLNRAWQDPATNVLAWVAWPGVGKTALLNRWREAVKTAQDDTPRPQRI